jgi:hypothetical protein
MRPTCWPTTPDAVPHLKEIMMKKTMSTLLLALTLTAAGIAPAHAHGGASALSGLSALPVASIVGGSAVAGSVVAVPLALSVTGTVLTVSAVEASANGVVLVLERASDGARASVELAGRGLAGLAIGVGSVVVCSVVGTGVVLSVASEAIAFIPNALGRALLHDERLSY